MGETLKKIIVDIFNSRKSFHSFGIPIDSLPVNFPFLLIQTILSKTPYKHHLNNTKLGEELFNILRDDSVIMELSLCVSSDIPKDRFKFYFDSLLMNIRNELTLELKRRQKVIEFVSIVSAALVKANISDQWTITEVMDQLKSDIKGKDIPKLDIRIVKNEENDDIKIEFIDKFINESLIYKMTDGINTSANVVAVSSFDLDIDILPVADMFRYDIKISVINKIIEVIQTVIKQSRNHSIIYSINLNKESNQD